MNQKYKDLLLLKLIKRIQEDGERASTANLSSETQTPQDTIYSQLKRLQTQGYIARSERYKGSKSARITVTHVGMIALVRFGSSRNAVDRILNPLCEHERSFDELVFEDSPEEYGALRVLLQLNVITQVRTQPIAFRVVRKTLMDPRLDMKIEACLAQY